MKISSENHVHVYELEGIKIPASEEPPEFVVASHWSRGDLVVVRVGGGSYTVSAADLFRAVRNSSD